MVFCENMSDFVAIDSRQTDETIKVIKYFPPKNIFLDLYLKKTWECFFRILSNLAFTSICRYKTVVAAVETVNLSKDV